MMRLCSELLSALGSRTIVTAESCTGGGIGAELTAVPGSSAYYKGGIISYTNWVKHHFLKVDESLLKKAGPVSAPVAEAMAMGAREELQADVAISVTGLAGPGADEYGNPVGTVFIGYSDIFRTISREYHFVGDRSEVRKQACAEALKLALLYVGKGSGME